ncbi:MAG TPA: hypothetical protein VLA61_07585 [Ideonella sp.]|uniref:hypothetical protein n=1 Tax=Ideonella sp. TaxID=1929293 RepID=UPI002D0F9713|nr:hypothetical protein [Ideonella sp.]HSI48112.1 hypothetical protein [Ideonella sp.]
MDANATPSLIMLPTRLKPLAALAMLLERLDRQPRQASAEQYQRLVRELGQLLANTPMDDALENLLQAFPALSEIYENQHYEQAGLCRSPLERSLNTELAATALLKGLRDTRRH